MTTYGDMQGIKKSSIQHVIDVIRWNYPISRIDIAKKTELSVASVSRIASKLIEDHYIEEVSSEFIGMGRKTSLLTLKTGSVCMAGVEFDGDQFKIAILDEKGVPLISEWYKYYPGLAAQTDQTLAKTKEKNHSIPCSCYEVAALIHKYTLDLLNRKKIPEDKLFGIGVGLPGIIDHVKGKVLFSSQLGWENIDLKEILESVIKKTCIVENDLKANIYGEYVYGIAKGSEIAVMIFLGSGLGSAVIVNGKVLRGVTNSAGEIGHISQGSTGALCKCGKVGCLQTNIAKSFILEEANKMAPIATVNEFMDAANQNIVWAKRILQKLVTNAAIAIDTAVCVYNPDTVILCGEMVDDYPNVYNEICQVFYKNYLWDHLKNTFKIHHNSFSGLGCIVGAGALVQDLYYMRISN